MSDINHELQLQALKIDQNTEVTQPPIALSIVQNNAPKSFGTLGNFSMITGKAKSRKSFFVAMLVAAALEQKTISNTISGHLEGNKTILYFDTEQAKYDVVKIYERLSRMAPKGIDNLQLFALRSLTPSERFTLIDYAINTIPNIGIVVIDGIRDLITSINDEAEATKITSKLLKWTEEKNIHIINVLHQNKGNNEARGHIGSEMINKAETVVSIAKDAINDMRSIVTAEQTRAMSFQNFAFSINDQGLPEVVDMPSNIKSSAWEVLSQSELLSIVRDATPTKVSASDFKKALKALLVKHSKVKKGNNDIVLFFNWLQSNEFIKVEGNATKKIVSQGRQFNEAAKGKQSLIFSQLN